MLFKMRRNLEPHLGTYVLCKGWIGEWKDLTERRPVRRVLIFKPTIKKANKDLLFKHLPIISKEHHLNLFIKKKDVEDYKSSFYDKKKDVFELNSPIYFTGVINKYKRSNGSWDYGIYPTKQSLIHYRMEEINAIARYLNLVKSVWTKEFYNFSQITHSNLLALSKALESAGNQLPTFRYTYKWYRNQIDEWLEQTDRIIKLINTACSNRAMRRANKVPEDLRNFVETYQLPD